MTNKGTTHIVLGGAGFIGSTLIEHLLLGDEFTRILVIDRANASNWSELETFRDDRIRSLIFDLTSDVDIKSKLTKYELNSEQFVVWHLAANSDIKLSAKDINIEIKDTFLTTIAAMKIVDDLDGKVQLIFTSTSAIYGHKPGILLEEELFEHNPISNYGIMKLASEHYIAKSFKQLSDKNKEFIIFRLPNVVGPRLTHGLIYDLFLQMKSNPNNLVILGNGNQTKQYVAVGELVEIMETARKIAPMGIYNLSPDGEGTSVRQIVTFFRSAYGNGREVQFGNEDYGWPGDIPNFQLANTKIKNLGLSFKSMSTEAIKQAIDENRNLIRD
jgi:UDP-glucose 4-epimerase